MSKYNIYEFQQFFKSKQDLSKDYLIEKYFKNNKEIENLQSQLQSYKDKEDKLRELFEDEKLKELNKYYYGDSYELDAHELRNDILQILNEGDK